MRQVKIRVTKGLSKVMPDKLVYRTLIWLSSIPKQRIFQEAFNIADPKKTAVDIGANRGVVSYFMSRRFQNVHCFEPNADLDFFLERVLPSNCILHTYALSDAPGESELSVVLYRGIPIHGQGRILETSKTSWEYAVQKIKLETLDSHGLKNIGIIKIDVEGHEEKVIQGGIQTLRENKPVLIIEIEKRHTGKSAKATVDWIESLGYNGFFFEGATRRGVSEYLDKMQEPGYPFYINDFLFLPK